MLYKKMFLLIPTASLLLTGCFDKTVSKDDMKKIILDAGDAVTSVTNVRIRNKIQHSYDYKEGEFYRYHNFALILAETECVWKENGSYYHYVNYTWTDKYNTDKEITKEEFDTLMSKCKNEVIKTLLVPVQRAFDIIDDPAYETTCKSSSGTYTMKSAKPNTASEGETSNEEKYTIKFKNNLPTNYKIDINGEQDWKYQYGKAEFINPKASTSE